MLGFKNLLVLVDTNIGDYPVQLTKAVELARANNATLTLLDVLKEPQSSLLQYKDFFSLDELTGMVKESRLRHLDSLASPLREDGLNVRTMVKTGTRFIETIKQVLISDHDIVISHASMQKAQLSGDDLNLMRKCPCPVWMIRNLGTTDKVLAAIDINMETSEQGRLLNRSIMRFATALASRDGSSACVVSCWSMFGEEALRNNSFVHVVEEKLQHMLESEKVAYQDKLDSLICEFDFTYVDAALLKGDPKQLIPRYVEEHQVTIVVMGTVGRTGIPGFFIGNTAETVLTTVQTSVIAIKPRGFESPVR